MSLLEDVTNQLNLRWAWEKVRRAATPGDVWVNEIELAGFEVDLERNLQSIATEIRKGRYRMRPLRPMAFPKNPTSDGRQQVRQYFNVAVRDQVAWTALINAIGPWLDPLMPAWSYGNRLFRSIWIDSDDENIRHRRIGSYRHTSGQIYLRFAQSWPIFRRHVFLATQMMNSKVGEYSSSQLTDEDAVELNLQERLEAEHRCPFVSREYWNERNPAGGKEELFWCSLDLEKFYPSFKLAEVRRNIVEFLPTAYKVEANRLLDSMLRFKLDTDGWTSKDLKQIGLRSHQRSFNRIPTGLYAAGFLANMGLLKVDLQVNELLKERDIAHFRFVDDHIVLAYSFEDMIAWIDEYLKLLSLSNTGARVNPSKIEPRELAEFFSSRKNFKKRIVSDRDSAKKKCKLNPQFPTPLMTKTLALVSAIARTDFNLLEESELLSLTDQLEHMLLVDLPETEIPEKTRLSFAATRLVRAAESRLSNNSRLAHLNCSRDEIALRLSDKDLSIEDRAILDGESEKNRKELSEHQAECQKETRRAFGLMRKVLQERPDRVRLWTRTIQMCRQTGVKGLKEIWGDIRNVENELENSLAAEYLMSTTLALLGSEVIIASRSVCDPDIADWRRKAAIEFLLDVSKMFIVKPTMSERSWFLEISWRQFCFGLFCADLIIKSSGASEFGFDCELPSDFVTVGKRCLGDSKGKEVGLGWAWWVARKSLGDLSSRANRMVLGVGEGLPPTSESHSFWRFFPFDVPPSVLLSMSAGKSYTRNVAQMGGWWHDALDARPEIINDLLAEPGSPTITRVIRNISLANNSRFVSLHKWCRFTQLANETSAIDPRTGEWTALEIVRQIAVRITDSEEFSWSYVNAAKKERQSPVCLHPANFRIPREWLETSVPTWSNWKLSMHTGNSQVRVELVPTSYRLSDSRYTPVSSPESALFDSVNPVRGLGLLLYGLLRRDFEFPSIWNGFGHSDVLSLLPRLLITEMTCSSWTLGVLLACLQPRAMENVFFLNWPFLGKPPHDDSVHDPLRLQSSEEVRRVIEKCQQELERNQLSTINHRARQLMPISIRQLSQPEWAKDFELSLYGYGADD